MSLDNTVKSESNAVRESWLRERALLERELLNEVCDPPPIVSAEAETLPRRHDEAIHPAEEVRVLECQLQSLEGRHQIAQHELESARVDAEQLRLALDQQLGEHWAKFESAKAQHLQTLQAADESAKKNRAQQQQQFDHELARQRQAFHQELARHRQAMEQQMATRDAEWVTRRDQEWAALKHAKEVHEVAVQRLKEELAARRDRERDELQQWRRNAEIELSEARRLFEQERLQQQTDWVRQRDIDKERLRREREDFEIQVRKAQAAACAERQQMEAEWRQTCETQTARLHTERVEFEREREAWNDRFRREQMVVQNGLQFFESQLSRVTEELRAAQRGLQAVAASAADVTGQPIKTESNPFPARGGRGAAAEPEPTKPMTLDEIRERLRQYKIPAPRHDAA